MKEWQKLIRVICKHFAYVNYGVFVSDVDAFSNDEGTFLLIKFNKAGIGLYYNEWIEGNFSYHEIDIDDTDLIEIFGEDFSKFKSLALKIGVWDKDKRNMLEQNLQLFLSGENLSLKI